MTADDVVILQPEECTMRPGNIFSPTELALIQYSVESKLKQKQINDLINMVQGPNFQQDSEEISSDVIAKL